MSSISESNVCYYGNTGLMCFGSTVCFNMNGLAPFHVEDDVQHPAQEAEAEVGMLQRINPHPTPIVCQPTWCVCQRCREMPSDIERKCCGQLPDFCISILAVQDLPDLGENHRHFRHAAYRQFVVWQYGALGHGHRVVIPSCCVCGRYGTVSQILRAST
uniref:P2X purinoreceptor 7 intracellular domain-containing protein n=1 Tax=Sinocyclocheilus grahami TaxID=75366 RepID=A0A672K456_SINGR